MFFCAQIDTKHVNILVSNTSRSHIKLLQTYVPCNKSFVSLFVYRLVKQICIGEPFILVITNHLKYSQFVDAHGSRSAWQCTFSQCHPAAPPGESQGISRQPRIYNPFSLFSWSALGFFSQMEMPEIPHQEDGLEAS